MRYGIFSDVHSNREALDAVLAALRREGVDRILCAGDLVGYAAQPHACLEGIRTACHAVVAGNHDWAAAGRFSDEWFQPDARAAIRWTREALAPASLNYLSELPLTWSNSDVTLAHGTLHEPEQFHYLLDIDIAADSFWIQKTPVAFVGHTHLPVVFVKDLEGNVRIDHDSKIRMKPGYQYLVNVGSVGQPRDHNPNACYCIYDVSQKEILFKRVSYPIASTQNKIAQAGLPAIFSQRLARGM